MQLVPRKRRLPGRITICPGNTPNANANFTRLFRADEWWPTTRRQSNGPRIYKAQTRNAQQVRLDKEQVQEKGAVESSRGRQGACTRQIGGRHNSNMSDVKRHAQMLFFHTVRIAEICHIMSKSRPLQERFWKCAKRARESMGAILSHGLVSGKAPICTKTGVLWTGEITVLLAAK